ncbi:MAG: hypothetical protein ACREEB_03720 [Caulobacteraceae bacterium]
MAGLTAAALLGGSAALAQCPCAAAQPSDYAAPAYPLYAPGGRLYYAPSVYEHAQDTAARVRAWKYRTYQRAVRWRSLKTDWPAYDYDMMYGPGAYAQNYDLPKYPIW